MDGGAWWAAVHGVSKSWTWLSDFTFTFHFHPLEKEMATHSSILAWRIPGTGKSGRLPSMGSHRVGHDRSDLAAATTAGSHFMGFCWVHTISVLYCAHLCMKSSLDISNFLEEISAAAATAAKLFQSCPTLCYPIDSSPPGFPVPGILQARILEWVAISFSNAWKWKVKVKPLSRVQLQATPWTAAYQAPPSMGFSRQVYWSGLSSPSPRRDL